jgi:hypothetical protein
MSFLAAVPVANRGGGSYFRRVRLGTSGERDAHLMRTIGCFDRLRVFA